MNLPKVSVIMPVFNAGKFLEPAIESILTQTFTDFEFLIGDDGSTDHSIEIINSFRDDRITIIRNGKNLGISETMNRLIEASRGEYIARQDSDDISLPERLQKQVNFLDKNPEIGLCGTNITYFGSKRSQIFMPQPDEDIKVYMLVNNPIRQPTIMFRKSCLSKYYDQSLKVSEDYAMCYELSKHVRLSNLPDSLLNYRWHSTNISITEEKTMVKNADSIRVMIFHETLAYEIEERETRLLNLVTSSNLTDNSDLLLFEKFLIKIRSHNKKTAYYNEKALQRRCFRLWSSACFKLRGISQSKKIRAFLSSDLFTMNDLLYSISIRNIRSLLTS